MPELHQMSENLIDKRMTQDLNYVDKPKKLFTVTIALYALIFVLFLFAALFLRFPVTVNAFLVENYQGIRIRLVTNESTERIDPEDLIQVSVINNNKVVKIEATVIFKRRIQKGNVIDVAVVQNTPGAALFKQTNFINKQVIFTRKQRLINFLFDRI